MKGIARLGARLFNVPLFLEQSKAEILAGVYEAKLRGDAMAPLDEDCDEDCGREGAIAVIPVHGSLVHRAQGLQGASGVRSYKAIGTELKAALADTSVAGIMLDCDSNGGEVAGCVDLADAIYKARDTKPIYAFVDEKAYSACYLLASGAHRIYLPRTGGVGSVGTLMMLRDQSAADEMNGLKYTPIFAGKRKVDGNPHAPLPDDVRARFQAEVNKANDLLVETVAAHRKGKTTAEKVRGLEAGTFSGTDGIAAGLADELATYDEAMAALTAAAAAHAARSNPLRSRLYMLGAVPALMAAKDASDDEIELLMRGESAAPNPGDGKGEIMPEANKPKTEEKVEGAKPADPVKPAGDQQAEAGKVVDINAARAEGEAKAFAYMQEVNNLCAIGGCPEKAADFIAKKVAIPDVQAALLAAKASKTDAGDISPHNPGKPQAQAADHGWSKIAASAGAFGGGYSPAGRPAKR